MKNSVNYAHCEESNFSHLITEMTEIRQISFFFVTGTVRTKNKCCKPKFEN